MIDAVDRLRAVEPALLCGGAALEPSFHALALSFCNLAAPAQKAIRAFVSALHRLRFALRRARNYALDRRRTALRRNPWLRAH